MRISDLRERIEHSFGAEWAPSFRKDIAISELGSRSVDEALRDGYEPHEIWKALCRAHPKETAKQQ
jgi:hypothetical protein